MKEERVKKKGNKFSWTSGLGFEPSTSGRKETDPTDGEDWALRGLSWREIRTCDTSVSWYLLCQVALIWPSNEPSDLLRPISWPPHL